MSILKPGQVVLLDGSEYVVIGQNDDEIIIAATGDKHRLCACNSSQLEQTEKLLDKNDLDEIIRSFGHLLATCHHQSCHQSPPFQEGKSSVPVSGRVYGAPEIGAIMESAFDCWLTTGRFEADFCQRFSQRLSQRKVLTCNSGSSANLLAVASLTSHLLGERALKPGDEVMTVAAGFPTTVAPLLQYGLTPVFVDVELSTLNINCELIKDALSEKTKAILIAHTLGNPFDLTAITKICKEHNLFLIEDCCDALGSSFDGKPVGTFGDVATFSFYPAHHITMGEGGAVATADPLIQRALRSFRDWGRDCWCEPGHDDTCKKRFQQHFGTLPKGYDHKYVYSHVGYNLKITDMQASIGLAQLDRLDGFIQLRRRNFDFLKERLRAAEKALILPQATEKSEPAWFGFPVTLRQDVKVNREELLIKLNERRIATRLLFGGNLTRQPFLKNSHYRIAESGLHLTDRVMESTFWLGLYPGLSEEQLTFTTKTLLELLQEHI